MKGRLSIPVERGCDYCGGSFMTDNTRKATCSIACHDKQKDVLRWRRIAAATAADGSRRCGTCKKMVGPEQWTPKSLRCRSCQAAYAAAFLAARPGYNRAKKLGKHGLTVAEFDAMLAAQGNRCGSCDDPEPGGHGTWHLDHDHMCCPGQYGCRKCIRGILCHACNLLLGNAKDDPKRLIKACIYLGAVPTSICWFVDPRRNLEA